MSDKETQQEQDRRQEEYEDTQDGRSQRKQSDVKDKGNRSKDDFEGGDGDDQDSDPEPDQDPPDDNGNGDDGGFNGDEGDSGPPTDEELRLLTFLWLIEQNDTRFDVTGFQAKRLYENTIATGDGVGQTYANLKGLYIASQSDADRLQLTPEARKYVKGASDVQTSVSEDLAGVIADRTSENQLLERLLWLAHSDEEGFEWYLDQYGEEIKEPTNLLSLFFDEGLIQSTSAIGAVMDELQDLPMEIYSEVEAHLSDGAYLKGLATVQGDVVTELLQLNTEDAIRCSDPETVLSYYVDDAKAEQIINDFRRTGIDINHNAFGIDIDRLLEQHRDELNRWLSFEQAACRRAFETNWDLILEWHRDFRGETEAMKQQLVNVGAVIPQGRYLAVRVETYDVAQEVINSLEEELHDRIGDLKNVNTRLFFDFDDALDQDEDILVVLHENSWSSNQYYYPAFISGSSGNRSDPDRNPLTEKVILVPSPSELGFKDDHLDRGQYHCHGRAVEKPGINREFNAIGEVEGLDSVKNEFTTVEWEKVDDATVQAAAQILEIQEQISLSEAFDKIADYDIRHSEALYTIAAKTTTKTSIDKGYYNEEILWGDVEKTLQIRYPSLTEEEFTNLKGTLIEVLVNQAGIDLVEFEDTERVYERFGVQLSNEMQHRIQGLSLEERRLLYVLVSGWADSKYIRLDRIQPHFEVYHEFWFGDAASSDLSLVNILVKSGVCTVGTDIGYQGDRKDEAYAIYLGVQKNPDHFLESINVEPDSESIDVLEQYADGIPQLAGLEYLIENNGEVQRSDLRDALLSIDEDAWMTFETIDEVLVERDENMILDPLILDEASRWITEAKRRRIEDIDEIERRLSQADVIDFKLKFDDVKRVYEGHLMTRDEEEIQVVVAPWLTETDSDWLDNKVVVILTNGYYKKFINRRRGGYKDSLIIGLDDDEFEVYRSLPYDSVAEPIIQAFETDYSLRQQELDLEIEETQSDSPTQPKSAVKQTTDEKEELLLDEHSGEEMQSDIVVSSVAEQPPEDTDLVAELFEQSEGSFPGDVLRDRPFIILLHKPERDRYGTALQFLCRELYHQYEGGLPRGHVRGNADVIERQLKAGNRIEFIDETEGGFFDHVRTPTNSVTGNSVKWGSISRRIQEMDTQGLGFLLFQLPTDFVSEFKQELKERVRPHRPQVIELEPRLPMDEYGNITSYYERTIPTAEALWGYPDLQSEFEVHDPSVEFDTFDDIFTLAERRAWRQLHDGVTNPINDGSKERSPVMVIQPHPTGDANRGNESSLHYALKVLVVRWLIESEGYTFGSITTETDTPLAESTDNGVIPDIQLNGTVFEIETLYGTGTPLLAIKETVEKYRKYGYAPNITIVLSPLAVFLHYSALRQLVHEINEEWKVTVELSIPVLKTQELTSANQLKRTIRGEID